MTWLWVAIAVALDGGVALACGLVPFATGTLLASGLAKILPEAVSRSGLAAVAWTLVAMVALGAIEWASARRGHHRDRPVVPAALLGSDALHNLGDGMAIAAAFLVTPRLGIVTSAAVILHELPEEIADYALLRGSGVAKRPALAGLALVQLTAGIGAAGTLLASSVLARADGVVLSVACGMFLYIAIVDLLPELRRSGSRSAVVAGLVGAAIVLVMS
jgi:zinc and cadmium transporter